MRKKYKTDENGNQLYKTYKYIPLRYVFAVIITIAEILAIISIVVALCYYVPYFYVLAMITEAVCVIKIIASDDNPDYKVPWLLFVLILPVAGFMLYFIFSSRKLKKKYVNRLKAIVSKFEFKDDQKEKLKLKKVDEVAFNQANMISKISLAKLYTDTAVRYFPSGEEFSEDLLIDLKKAERFILIESFIIEEGKFWGSVLEILKEKVKAGVDVRIVYDDIGCMQTLPGNYAKTLNKIGIKATTFARLVGEADSEFNNRSHRKIVVIDGKVGYTGGINIADEYINERVRFGHWKDSGVRLEGSGVNEFSKLFFVDYGINVKELPELPSDCFSAELEGDKGYVIPFGDGPSPLYPRRVSKTVIQAMLANAQKYVYITTPYLIVDNDLLTDIENTALRGVDVRIIVPHIPDKKVVFAMTKSYYPRLMKAGVKILEYEPGFIHAKTYLVDGVYAMVGTINLDYRSLVHHFENGVWMYKTECIKDIENDFNNTFEKTITVTEDMLKNNLFQRMFRAIVRIFAPLL